MEELSALEEDRHREDISPAKEGVMRLRSRVVPPGTASDEMCTFLILNISSLQLIPVNIIAYRSQYGSVDPAAIIGPAIVATMVSTGVGVIFCLIMQKKLPPADSCQPEDLSERICVYLHQLHQFVQNFGSVHGAKILRSDCHDWDRTSLFFRCHPVQNGSAVQEGSHRFRPDAHPVLP